jgi:hypothetical protein
MAVEPWLLLLLLLLYGILGKKLLRKCKRQRNIRPCKLSCILGN